MKTSFAHREVDLLGYKFEFSPSMQFAILTFLVLVLVYALLFSPYPAVHDLFHQFRHSFGLIPCH